MDSIQLKALRDRLLLTREELASEIGVPTSAVADWERGEDRPRGAALKLSEMLSDGADQEDAGVGSSLGI
jgi:DNA-binding transcriptional regulator YiaG